jgi:SAM-dependent methyltransferase
MTGLELAESSAQAASRLYSKVLTADVCAIPAKADSFDGAASIFLLEHLSAEAAPKALRELARVLRRGGKLICVCDLECDHPLLNWARSRHPQGYHEAFIEVPGHWGLRREKAWKTLLQDAGFVIIEWRLKSRFPILDHCPWVQLSLSKHLPALAQKLGRFAYWLSRQRGVSPAWLICSTLLDDVFRPVLPRNWAYRLLFVAEKRSNTVDDSGIGEKRLKGPENRSFA